MRKKLALVNYHDPFFWPFAQRLASDGFDVYFINTRPISSAWHREQGADPARVCDVLEGEDSISCASVAAELLKEYEMDGLPTINSIVLMDQNLRNAAYPDALIYLANSAVKVRAFLEENGIEAVSSGRDTSLQFITMLICKKLGIWWGCVTRPKLPKEWFGFSPTLQGDRFIPLREVTPDDVELARTWLARYRADITIKPHARPKVGGVSSFLKDLLHAATVLLSHLQQAIKAGKDRKIPGARVSLHIRRYIRELVNYANYRLFLKFDEPGEEPFVLYGLHRQPESSIDVRGAFFDDQMALVKQIARSLPVSHKLYVKVHFSDVAGQSALFYKKLRSLPGVKLITPDADSRKLVQKAAIVITNVGAMGQEGGYLGRPVIAMSRMFWCDLPTVVQCGTPSELPGLISRMISHPPADDFDAAARELAGYLANSFQCDPNLGFINPSFSTQELDVLAEAYEQVWRLSQGGKSAHAA